MRVRALCLALSIGSLLAADSGVLLPVGRQQPDSAVFSLDEMWIDVHIDNGDARVSIRRGENASPSEFRSAICTNRDPA